MDELLRVVDKIGVIGVCVLFLIDRYLRAGTQTTTKTNGEVHRKLDRIIDLLINVERRLK